jgi:hypothetical protein
MCDPCGFLSPPNPLLSAKYTRYGETWLIRSSRDQKKKKVFELGRTCIIQILKKIVNSLLKKLVLLLLV